MATTRISDVIVPEIFQALAPVNSPEKTAFFTSGIVVRNTILDNAANSAGADIVLPFWKDLDASGDPNMSSDNPAEIAAADKVTQGSQRAYKAGLNKGYSAADLASEVVMGDMAMEHVRARLDNYWARQWQKRLISSTVGVMYSNIANNAGDMVISVAAESTGAQSATTRFNAGAFTDAVYTMGDSAEGLSAVCVHSQVMSQMSKNDDIVYRPDSTGTVMIPTYKGMRVIIDDGMPVLAGTTSGFKYVSAIFGPGAFGYGKGVHDNPIEIERAASAGNGSGIETLWSRKMWILHPLGFTAAVAPAGNASGKLGHTRAELATAATWSRVIERKNVPMAFLITN